MTAAPALTVVMSVYNDGPFVGAAIDSILAQSFHDFEFLIIDDHSADDSAAVIAQRAAADPRIRVIPSPEKGRVPALNGLFAQARAPWVALMDSDDISLSDRFERELAFLAAHPDHGAISCNCAIIDAQGNPLVRPAIDRPLVHEGILANLEAGPLLNHNAVIVSRAAVERIGGYRAAFRHAEDYDLWLRLSQVTRLANLPDSLVKYRVYPGQVSSAHIVEQTRNAVIGWLAHERRLAGLSDPTEGLADLPGLDGIDDLFGPGSARYARRRIVERILFCADALTGGGWSALIGHIADSGPAPHLWRAAARMLRAGKPLHAARTALALAAGRQAA